MKCEIVTRSDCMNFGTPKKGKHFFELLFKKIKKFQKIGKYKMGQQQKTKNKQRKNKTQNKN